MKLLRPVILALLVIALGCEAQAYYNPSAGRWLSSDPIGEFAWAVERSP